MNRLLLLTRPADERARTAAAARRAGFATLSAPLLRIRALPFRLPAGSPDALLLTSARTPPLLAGHPQLANLPVFAVGAHSAAAARRAGFHVAHAGATDVSAALARAAAMNVRHMLHPGGADRAPIAVPPGLALSPFAVYEADLADALPPRATARLAAGDVLATLLFSPRTAIHFASLVQSHALPRASLALVVLSRAVAEAAGPGWRAVSVAPNPSLAGALAAAASLDRETRPGASGNG